MLSYTLNKETGEVDAHDKHDVHVEEDPAIIGEAMQDAGGFFIQSDYPSVEKFMKNEVDKQYDKTHGKKDDSGKLDWSLLAFSVLEDMVRVMQFGIEKYKERDSWKTVPNGEDRYRRAAVRHALKMSDGEMTDEESGLPHAAHVMVDLMFAEWIRKNGGA